MMGQPIYDGVLDKHQCRVVVAGNGNFSTDQSLAIHGDVYKHIQIHKYIYILIRISSNFGLFLGI